jgi:hydroxyethylthiazole kinase
MSLSQIRARGPLVHCITNTVVTNFSANGLLAVGASPIMADAIEEIDEIVQISDALLVNIGTLNARTVAAMDAAIDVAARKGIPIVLDPVGAGASQYRLETVQRLLQKNAVTLIRCNAGELAAIAGVNWTAKGVDSGSGEADIEPIAREVAARYHCLVIVTGEADVLTDGQSFIRVRGGNEKITRITGTGCLLSALSAAVLASTKEPLSGLEGLLADYKQAAEQALAPIGTYQVQFLNELERLSEVEVR